MGGSVSLIDGHIDEPKPCADCEIRKCFAIRVHAYWHDGVDCPFECPQWDEWKARENA